MTEKKKKREVTKDRLKGREGEIKEQAKEKRRIGEKIHEEKENRRRRNDELRLINTKNPKAPTFKWKPKLALKR